MKAFVIIVAVLTVSALTARLAVAACTNSGAMPRLGETVSAFEARTGCQLQGDAAGDAPRTGESVGDFRARSGGQPSPRPALGTAKLRSDRGGHFTGVAVINGEEVRVIVDTGASAVSLPYEDARRLGYRLDDRDFRVESKTANGSVNVAIVQLEEMRVGNVVVRDVLAAVYPPRALHVTLLGMTFLRKLKGYQVDGEWMVLRQ